MSHSHTAKTTVIACLVFQKIAVSLKPHPLTQIITYMHKSIVFKKLNALWFSFLLCSFRTYRCTWNGSIPFPSCLKTPFLKELWTTLYIYFKNGFGVDNKIVHTLLESIIMLYSYTVKMRIILTKFSWKWKLIASLSHPHPSNSYIMYMY